ncbi:DUF5624 domain-containing protein [Microbacterium sp. 2FI]|uniref:DUF5624 domain-containing protein n=1 Tax=Microbacterium sp. 2FI TaxID=2502193 RepID=UPI0010F4912A|nr:DUF5624 domain-containing protein [Microbacterium sp. 2FI]
MSFYESPELKALFAVYSDSKSPHRDSIADHLSILSMKDNLDAPLIVATATDLAVYGGSGAAPQVRGFRANIPGFTELTAISHLGPALGTLVALAVRGESELWREDAQRLRARMAQVRIANKPDLWRGSLGIRAFIGREDQIAAMVDYACELADHFLARALHEPDYLTPVTLRSDYLDVETDEFPVSGNKLMIATFGLYALDHAHGLIDWFDELQIDWPRAIFAITGRQGRPTAGTTKGTTNLVRILRHISGDRLPLSRVFVAPTMSGFESPANGDLSSVIAAEGSIRWQVARVMSSTEIAPLMYEGYPTFVEPPLLGPELTSGIDHVSEFPPVRHERDWDTMITRLRLTLEDPRQLLAAGVTDFVTQRLVAAANDPRKVVVPGIDTDVYPARSAESANRNAQPDNR